MTAPTFTSGPGSGDPYTDPAHPTFVVEPTDDFGPDSTRTTPRIDVDNLPPVDPPKNGRKPRSTASTKKSSLFGLGENDKPRSGVRALTKKDRKSIAEMYVMLGGGLLPFAPKLAETTLHMSGKCADSWMAVAEKNNRVRQIILGMMEGGAWGGLFMAHIPMLIAAVPRHTVSEETSERLDDIIDTLVEKLTEDDDEDGDE